MKTLLTLKSIGVIAALTAIAFSAPARPSTALDGMAFLDLSLCYGLGKPEELAKSPNDTDKDARVLAMERVLRALKSEQYFAQSDKRGTYVPRQQYKALGFPIYMINPHRYGPHKGIAVGLEDSFVDVRDAFEQKLGVKYSSCKLAKAQGFRACHRELMPGYGHVLLTAPEDVDSKVVSICVHPDAVR